MKHIETIVGATVGTMILLAALGLDPSWAAELGTKVLLFILPGAISAVAAEAVAAAFIRGLPFGLGATLGGVIYVVCRIFFAVAT